MKFTLSDLPANEAETPAEPVTVTTPMTVSSALSTPTTFNKSIALPMASGVLSVDSEVGQVTVSSNSQSNNSIESGTEETRLEELESLGELEVRILCLVFLFSYSGTVTGNRTASHAETRPYTKH